VQRFASVLVYLPDFEQHTDITLQDTLHRDYTLRLFIENQELGLQTQDNRTWTPAQRPYVPYIFPLHILTDSYSCVEVFLRHPRCALRSK
jgi:hypothetical protein